ALAVEGDRELLAVRRERAPDRGQDVVAVVGLRLVGAHAFEHRLERGYPFVGGPEGRVVGADRDDVVLAGAEPDVLGDFLPELVLRKDHEVERYARLLRELRRVLLHDDHVGIVDRRDGQRRLALRERGQAQNDENQGDKDERLLHLYLLWDCGAEEDHTPRRPS